MLFDLFEGYNKARLEFQESGVSKTGKVEGRARTVKQPFTRQCAENHMAGQQPSYGVAPIYQDETGEWVCRWGALDIDKYPISDAELDAILKACAKAGPLAAFWSKSGGLHVDTFVKEPVPAVTMIDYLKAMRRRLPKEHRSCEIFPKQARGTDKAPSALNLPLFGQARTFARGWSDDKQEKVAETLKGQRIATLPPDEVAAFIHQHCRVSSQWVIEAAARNTDRATTYKVPTRADGRNDLLNSIAASMQARGWTDDDLRAELRRLNERWEVQPEAIWRAMYGDRGLGPLPTRDVDRIVNSALTGIAKGVPGISGSWIEEWPYAQIKLHGKVSYIDKKMGDYSE